MNTWADDELRITTIRDDGSPRTAVTIWFVQVDGDLYVRSAQGPQNGWFRRARSAGAGRISSGGVETDAVFEPAPAGVRDAVTAEYHAKYDRFGPGPVGSVTGPDALETTLRVVPVAAVDHAE